MSTTADQIDELGARWVAAELAGDTDTLESIVTDEFRLVGPFGFVLNKDQWLDRYRSGDFTTTELTWHDVDIRTTATPPWRSAPKPSRRPTRDRPRTATSGSATCSSAATTSGRSPACSSASRRRPRHRLCHEHRA
jgi:Domain of unknown function (DUF4440)